MSWLANVPRPPVRTMVLVGANLVLVALLAALILEPAGVPVAATAQTSALSASALDLPARNDSLAVVGTQPVFHKTRQFISPPAPEAPDLRPPPPNYQFAGAMVLPGRPPVAYLRGAQASQPVKVSVGEVLEGWTVSAIEPRAVILAFSGEFLTIGNARQQTGGIVAIAPRAAASEPAASEGVRVLGNPGQSPRPVPPLAASPVPERKPRTYQPPPPT